MRAAVLIAAMSIVTMLLRFLPFIVFRKQTPQYILYLGKVLPPAIIGMLVIYCLKDNPTKNFYEYLGGKLVFEKKRNIGGKDLIENVYYYHI